MQISRQWDQLQWTAVWTSFCDKVGGKYHMLGVSVSV